MCKGGRSGPGGPNGGASVWHKASTLAESNGAGPAARVAAADDERDSGGGARLPKVPPPEEVLANVARLIGSKLGQGVDDTGDEDEDEDGEEDEADESVADLSVSEASQRRAGFQTEVEVVRPHGVLSGKVYVSELHLRFVAVAHGQLRGEFGSRAMQRRRDRPIP